MRMVWTLLSAPAAMAVMVLGFVTGAHAQDWAEQATRPEVAAWALQSAAVALLALGQLIVLFLLIRPIYRRDGFSLFLYASAGLLFAMASISAMALGLASR